MFSDMFFRRNNGRKILLDKDTSHKNRHLKILNSDKANKKKSLQLFAVYCLEFVFENSSLGILKLVTNIIGAKKKRKKKESNL